MKPATMLRGILVLFFVLTTLGAAAQAPPERLPWTLREHYTFSNGPLRLDYAVDNAEWRIRIFEEDSETSRMTPQIVVRDVGFVIELSDGRLLTHDTLSYGGETHLERAPASHAHLGDGMTYTIQFVPQDGIRVWHRLSTFRQWQFVLVTVGVENISEAPLNIARITSATFGPGAIAGLSEAVQSSARHVAFREKYPVFAKDGVATKMRFFDPARNISMTFGLIPHGLAASSLDIQSGGGAWQGRAESCFAPGKTLMPGQSLESDPLWVNFGTYPAVADAHYAWALSNLCAEATSTHMPRAWVTIPDTEGLSTLRSETTNAQSSGIMHALIPGNWEGRPGSFEGATPRYPRNIGDAARALREAGAIPGITVDPLLGQGGADEWTTQSRDGQTWVDLSMPAGHDFAVKRMQRLIEWGFGFIVIEPSRIPDDALQHFGMSRAQADSLSFTAARQAAEHTTVAVLPAAAGQLTLNRDDWLEAASAVSRGAEYEIATAPVRLQAQGNTPVEPEVMTALGFWRGPFEFVGAPARALQRDMAALLRKPVLSVRPQDATNRAPLVWLARVNAPGIGFMGANIISFSGATPWALSSVESFSGEDEVTVLWRPQGEQALAITNGIIDGTPQLTTHGLLANSTQPLFAGVGEDITLGLERLRRINWDSDNRILTGQIDGPLSDPFVAFFLAPPHLQLRAARVGSKQVRPVVQNNWISLPMAPSGGAFELEFTAG